MVIIVDPRVRAVVRVEAHGECMVVLPEVPAGQVLHLAGAVLSGDELWRLEQRLAYDAPDGGAA